MTLRLLASRTALLKIRSQDLSVIVKYFLSWTQTNTKMCHSSTITNTRPRSVEIQKNRWDVVVKFKPDLKIMLNPTTHRASVRRKQKLEPPCGIICVCTQVGRRVLNSETLKKNGLNLSEKVPVRICHLQGKHTPRDRCSQCSNLDYQNTSYCGILLLFMIACCQLCCLHGAAFMLRSMTRESLQSWISYICQIFLYFLPQEVSLSREASRSLFVEFFLTSPENSSCKPAIKPCWATSLFSKM